MRVLVVAHNAVAGSNRQRVDALARVPGLEVTLLTPSWWEEEGRRIQVASTDAAYAWHVGRTIATNNGTRYLYRDRLFGLVRQLQPDVLDVQEEPFSFAAAQALLARRLLAPTAALVFYSAVNVPRRWRAPYRLSERLVLHAADGAYTPNSDVPKILAAKGLRVPAQVVPLGVEVGRFGGAAPLPLAERLDGAPRPYLGFLGRLEPVKGLDVLLDAVSTLRARGTLIVAGDGRERARLEDIVRTRGIAQRVRFLGAIDFDTVPGFLKALDLLVLPSVTLWPTQREQFGRVLAEAMAAGVPVIGSSSGAIPEVIGDAGLVVPERNPVALARALDRLIADAALRQELAARGQRRAERFFAWDQVARATVDRVYGPALAHRRDALDIAEREQEESLA
ncbi:MAG: glycosyltransferase family 4 protein [Chloroflexi bacterium]|nr:glycosyltransferase family 4 protein [Chloroflexota bacterium]